MDLPKNQNNLYYDSRIYVLGDGSEELIRNAFTWIAQETDLVHVVSLNETCDLLAWKYYKDKVEAPERFWWLIAQVNDIENPTNLDDLVGLEIIIPDVLLLSFVRGLQV